jgi:mono/diheme cytochrome c family protein
MLKLTFAALVVFAAAACPNANQNPKPAPVPTAPAPTPNANPGALTPAQTNPNPNPTPTPPAAATKQDPAVEAEQIFTQRCSVCHGMDGKGDGPGAAALNPKPQNYTDAKFQAEVTDETIAKAIVEGGQSVGKSPLMVPNADLKDKPDVVKALVAKVRSFKGK